MEPCSLSYQCPELECTFGGQSPSGCGSGISMNPAQLLQDVLQGSLTPREGAH